MFEVQLDRSPYSFDWQLTVCTSSAGSSASPMPCVHSTFSEDATHTLVETLAHGCGSGRVNRGSIGQIIELWFANYKGPDGGMEGLGFAEAETARSVLEAAAANFVAAR